MIQFHEKKKYLSFTAFRVLRFNTNVLRTFRFSLVMTVIYCYSFGEGKSDKEILDNLLLAKRYDKRLLPPVTG